MPPELSGKGARRRRIGLGVSGLIMTLASKPGMATTPMYCGSVSGWQSASTASQTKADGGKCMGLSAGYWVKHDFPSGWQRSDLFSKMFPEGRGTLYKDSSLDAVLVNNDSTFDQWNLRREFICAYLNAVAGFNTHPSTAELKAIWTNYAANQGYRIASSGKLMGGEQLKNYLAASHDGI